MSAADIRQIVEAARRRNTLWCITGLLLHGIDAGGRLGFVQWIEGDPEDTENLFSMICADPRHADVVRLAAGRDLACYALPTRGPALQAAAVDALPETVEAFLTCAAALHDAPELLQPAA